MHERIVFKDLVGHIEPQRPLTPDEDHWLADLVAEADAAELTIQAGRSIAGTAPEPVLSRQLDGTWRAGRYVGELWHDGRVLEIQPRLGIEPIAAWASAALNVRIVPRAAEHGGTAVLIAELVAGAWRAAIVEATRHGLPGFRDLSHYEGPHVRGRLDVARTLKLRAARRPHVASTARPKIVDNPVTRTIVLADRVLDRRIRRPDWRGDRVEEIMPRLRGAVAARPRLPSRHELDSVRYTPIALAYKRAAELSWQIARNRGLRTTATGEKTGGLLVDVAELWELFLVHCAKRALGSSRVTHGTQLREGRALLHSATHERATMGRLYPDILVGPPDAPTAVIDAKYKPLADPRGVDREDLYQLTSYLSVHLVDPKPLGMLAYTQFPGQQALAAAEAKGPWLSAHGHTLRFERLPITERECVAEMGRLLEA